MSGTSSFRTFVVVNPNASGGATGRRWPELSAAIGVALGDAFGHALTTHAGEATELARRALSDGYEMIVSIGGDGTNNEVVNGFFGADGLPIRADAVFAHVPSGTGGDFRKTIGLDPDPLAAIRRLTGRDARPIDAGRVTFVDHDGREATRHFLNITSFGIGGLVDAYVNRSSKRLGGKMSFFLAATHAMFTYRNQRITLSLDGGPPEEVRINNVAVANGQFFGGGMWVAPTAAIDDGLFDVVTFGDLTKLQYLALSGSIYKGQHIGRPKIDFRRAAVVVAESEETVLIDMDGEQPGRLPIRLEILPGILRLKS